MPDRGRRESMESMNSLSISINEAGIKWKKRVTMSGATSHYSETEKAFGFLDRYFAHRLVGGATSLTVEQLITDCINAGLKEQQIDEFEDFCGKYGGSVSFPEFLELMFISAAKWNEEQSTARFEWKKMCVGRDDGQSVNAMSAALWPELFDTEERTWPAAEAGDDRTLKVPWARLRKLLADPQFFPFEVTRTETYDLVRQAADAAEQIVGGSGFSPALQDFVSGARKFFAEDCPQASASESFSRGKFTPFRGIKTGWGRTAEDRQEPKSQGSDERRCADKEIPLEVAMYLLFQAVREHEAMKVVKGACVHCKLAVLDSHSHSRHLSGFVHTSCLWRAFPQHKARRRESTVSGSGPGSRSATMTKRFATHRPRYPLFEGVESVQAAIRLEKELRIFVSFGEDFAEESAFLLGNVFPTLRRLCHDQGVNLVEVDVRTSTKEAQSKSQAVLLKQSLGEILRCQYFVSFVGTKYQTPLAADASQAPQQLAAEAAFPQFRDVLKRYRDRSLQELEIRAAVLNCKPEDRVARRVWMFVRDDGWRGECEQSSALRTEMSDLAKEENFGDQNTTYAVWSGAVGARVEGSLVSAVRGDLPQVALSLFEQEEREQEKLERQLLAKVVDLPTQDGEMELAATTTNGLCEKVLQGTGSTFAVFGPQGSGKSSICATIAKRARECKEHVKFVHLHGVECSRQSKRPVFVMLRLLQNLKVMSSHPPGCAGCAAANVQGLAQSSLDLNVDIPRGSEHAPHSEVSHLLLLALTAAHEKLLRVNKTGVIILDAVDQLDDHDGKGPLGFGWIKRQMPARLKLVFSYSDNHLPWLQFASDGAAHLERVHVPVPSAQDGVEIIARLLRRCQSGRFGVEQRKQIEDWLAEGAEDVAVNGQYPQRRLPLFLNMLGDEIRKLDETADTAHMQHRLLGDLSTSVCVGLMKKVLARSALEYGDQDLFKLVACMLCSTREGLEAPGSELHACLTHTGRTYDVLRLREALELLEPFLRRSGDMLVPRNRMVVQAVMEAFVTEDDGGLERRTTVLECLRWTFSGWQTRPAGEKVTQREAQEVPFLLKEQVSWYHGQILQLEPKIKAAKKSSNALMSAALEDEKQRIGGDLKDTVRALRNFLHRLDVFLFFHQQDNPHALLRFEEVLPSVHFFGSFKSPKPQILLDFTQFQDEFGKAVYLDELKQVLDSATGANAIGEALSNYGKVANFLVHSGKGLLKGACGVLSQGIDKARESIATSVEPSTLSSRRNIGSRLTLGEPPLTADDDGGDAKTTALVVLLFEKSQLFGRHRYQDDQTDAITEQCVLLKEAWDLLVDGGKVHPDLRALLSAKVFLGIGYLCQHDAAKEHLNGSLPETDARVWFETAIELLTGMEWMELREYLIEGIRVLNKTDVRKHPDGIRALADAFNVLGETMEKSADDIEDADKRHAELLAAERACSHSVEVGKVLEDDNAADIGRSLLSLGKLQMRLALEALAKDPSAFRTTSADHDQPRPAGRGCQPRNWRRDALWNLQESHKFYLQGLGDHHVRMAHPLHAQAKAYLDLYEANDSEHRRLKQLKTAHRWAKQALRLRDGVYRNKEFGQDLIHDSQALVNDIERNIRVAETQVLADHASIPLFEGICESPLQAINLQREVRVFVSSTFVDFQRERELLIRKTFPHIRQTICNPRGVSLVEIDLRTGVTEKQSSDGQVLKLCLGEVLKCQYFVSMLGIRYGWCQDFEKEEDTTLSATLSMARKEFPQFADILDAYDDRSITELEIRAAALNVSACDRRARRTWFHLRKEDYKRGEGRFGYEDENKYEKVKALRSAIKEFAQQEGVVRNIEYSSPDEVASRIEADLVKALEEDLPAHDAMLSDAQREDSEQENMAKLMSRRVLELEGTPISTADNAATTRSTLSLTNEILESGGGQTFALVGSEGSGKSSTCAFLAKRAREAKMAFVHLHMVECTEESGKPINIMRRMLQRVTDELHLTDIVMPSTLVEMSQTLFLALGAASKKLEQGDQHGIIIVDAVDRLEDVDGLSSSACSWLKWAIPPRFTLVFSFGTTTKWLDFVREGTRSNLVVRHVPVPGVDDGVEVVSKHLKKFSKSLDANHSSKLREWLELDKTAWFNDETFFNPSHPKPQRRLPLFLTELGEEIRKMGQFSKLDEHIQELLRAERCTELISRVLCESAEVSGTPELFKLVTSLICSARAGLEVHGRDTELLRCLQKAEEQGRLTALHDRAMQVEHTITLFWRYTRRVGRMPVRVAANNQMVIRAVSSAFMDESKDGIARRKLVLELLTSCFSTWTQAGMTATVRETQEFPYCVAALAQEFHDDRSSQLRSFLHRLDVFLLLYKRDNPEGLRRFENLVPLESYFVDSKVVYLEALAQAYDTADKTSVGAVLDGYVKVADFLVSLGRMEPAHAVLKDGVARARSSYRYYREQRGADEATLQTLQVVLIHLLTKLDELYGRNRYKPDDEELDVQAEQGQLLLEAHHCLQDLQGSERDLLQAQVLEGIGYLCLRSKAKLPDQLQQDARQTAEEWFIDVIRTLTKAEGEQWQEFDTNAARSRGAVWVKQLADAHNALVEAFEPKLKGTAGVAETPEYTRAVQAAEKAVKLGNLLEGGNDADIGKYWLSLGKLHIVAGRWEEAIKTLEKSKTHYRTALGDMHVRVAWPYQKLAEVHYEMAQQGGNNNTLERGTAKKHLWLALSYVERALSIRKKGYNTNFGREFIEQSAELQTKIQHGLKLVSSQESFKKSLAIPTNVVARKPSDVIAETKEVRVYVSSTLEDFGEERELLNSEVFPELRALCHSRGVSLIETDLRTGVLKEQANYEHVVNLALGEIDQCQYFVCLIGRRYGWCTSGDADDQFVSHAEASRAHPQFGDILAAHWGSSLVELELRAAALDVEPSRRVGRKIWFHLRDVDGGRGGVGEQRFDYEDETRQSRLHNLHRLMENFYREAHPGEDPRSLMCYSKAQNVASRIKRQLMKELQDDLPLADAATEQVQEDERQAVMQRQLLDRFVPINGDAAAPSTQAVVDEILASKGGKMFALVGPEGSGKSSLCAHLAARARSHSKLRFVHLHLVECSEESAQPVAVMRRLLKHLKRELILDDVAVPTGPAEMSQTLCLALSEGDRRMQTSGQHGVIIIDGIDRLEHVDVLGPLAYSWMTREMPTRIKLVFSAASNSLAVPELEWLGFLRDGVAAGTIQAIAVPIPAFDDAVTIVAKRLGRHGTEALGQGSIESLRAWVEGEAASGVGSDVLDVRRVVEQEKRLPLFLALLGDEIAKRKQFLMADVEFHELLRERCRDLMIMNLKSTAAELNSDGKSGTDEVFKLAVCLIACTRQGLEVHCSVTEPGLKLHQRQSELMRCLNKAEQDAMLPAVDRIQVEMAIAQLAPFTCKIGTPVRLRLRNQTLTRAVHKVFMDNDEEGQAMRARVLSLLVHCFCSWNSGEARAVTKRESAELPAVLQAQRALDQNKSEGADRSGLLRKFLHRLDVFLLLYRNDDPREFQRFQAMVPTESYVVGGKVVYHDELQAAVVRELQEAVTRGDSPGGGSPALASYIKVAKFLVHFNHAGFLEAAHVLLLNSLESARQERLAHAHRERAQMACALNSLYGRYRYRPDDEAVDVAEEQGRLLLEAHRELDALTTEAEWTPEVDLIKAEVLQGIGYLSLFTPAKVPTELKSSDRPDAEAWFIEVVRALTGTDLEDWEQFDPDVARARSAVWIKALADAHNALADAFELRLQGDEWAGMSTDDTAESPGYRRAVQASTKAVQLGMLLKEGNDADIGKYWLSLGKLQMVAGRWEEAIKTLEESKKHYQDALTENHPRLAWPYRKLGEVYLKQAASSLDAASRHSLLHQAKANADLALNLWKKAFCGDFGQPLVVAAGQLVAEVEKALNDCENTDQ